MRAISIAEYLDRAGRAPAAAPRAEAEPVHNAAPAAMESRPAPSLLHAVRKVAAPAEPGMTIRPKSESPAPARDVEAMLTDAYERGLREGRAAAIAEAAETHAMEKAAATVEAASAQLAFKSLEYARLSDDIAAGLAAIEERISACVARILAPTIEAGRTDAIVRELREALARLAGGGSPGLMKIRGPETLLAKLRESLAGLAIDVEYTAQPMADVIVEAGGARIATQLQAWKDFLAARLD